MRQARKEVPRFSRQARMARTAKRSGFTTVSGRGAVHAATSPPATAQFPASPVPAAPRVLVKRRSVFYRHRYQLIPVGWALTVLGAGSAAHAAHSVPGGLIATLVLLLAGVALIRHLQNPPELPTLALIVLTLTWLPVITLTGLPDPAPAVYLTTWAIASWRWATHYRIRPGEPEDEIDQSDMELWAATLGAKGKLAGSRLHAPQPIANGMKYTLVLRRGEQDTSDVFTMPKKIASLFGKPVTEVYPERFPDGREHMVTLTLLKSNTLSKTRLWDGEGIDPATGLAVIGDYPDGSPAHFRFWSPRNGAEQSIAVGVKGAGKSYVLHLLLSIALRSEVPVIPIVLDPQQGQSLPDWRGQVPYASGVAECMTYLRAFEAGMMARSSYLATHEWTDEDGYLRPGMDFYDPQLSGLPLMFMVFDEAHLVLADPKYGEEAKRITGNLVKLDRKAGGHLALISHTLLLSQLGDMTLRAMVLGGNAVCLRTGEALSGSMIGLEADPKLLPRTFPDGTETQGLGYLVGPDARPDSPMRARLVRNPRQVAVESPLAEMDDVFGRAFRAVIDRERGYLRTPKTRAPEPEPEDRPGRRAIDAVMTVLDARKGPMNRGEIFSECRDLVTAPEWGREKEFTSKALQNALNAGIADGRIGKPDQDKPIYASVVASRNASEQNGHAPMAGAAR